MLTGINHVQITIPEDMEEVAREFYCNVLGLNEIEKPEILKPNGGFWLQLGNIQVHIGTESGVDRSKTKAHVAYEVRDIENWRMRLESLGIMTAENTPIPGFERFEFRDPFGNRIELIERNIRQ